MEKTKVKTLVRQIRGVSYKPEDLHNELDDNSVVLLRANNIDEGKINFDDVVYVDKSKVSDEQYLKYGDILICASSGSKNLVGKAASIRFNTECTFGAFCKVIRPKEGLDEYLSVYFQSPIYRRKISEVAIGININNIRNEHIDELDIPVFSNDEQASIVKKIHLIQEVISNRKAELEKLDDLIKARFVEMFGDLADPECSWNKRKLIEVCVDKDDIKCGPFGTQLSKDEYMESGIAVWEIPQINIAFKSRPVHFITSEKSEQLKAYTIIPGDIAMSRKGNVGKCAIFPESYPAGIIHSDVLRIRLNSQVVNPMFMMCQLHFSGAVTRQIELVSSGAIMAGVNVTKLKQIYVHIPPIELQNQFADFVRVVDKSKVAVQKTLEQTQTLFDSLMQKYFG